MGFFRFPHTPHLLWLGKGQPRDDKVLTPDEASRFLAYDIVVEEKVDGANVGLSVDVHGGLRAQNRGRFLSQETAHPQFKPFFRWLRSKQNSIIDALYPDLILFGEWCFAVHSIRYSKLPDWFLAFDVYDQNQSEFWSVARRDGLVRGLNLELVPELAAGRFTIAQLQKMRTQSMFGEGSAEGLYLRRDKGDRLVSRAKVVWGEFNRGITNHWSRQPFRTNALVNNQKGQTLLHTNALLSES